MLVGGMRCDDLKAILPLSPAWMIPEIAREGNLLGIDFDPAHIPEILYKEDLELSGDYIRVVQTIHVEDEIARYGGPVLIVHGDADDVVPYSYAERANELYKNATLVPVHGADHCFVGHLDELYEAVKGFLAGMCVECD